MKTLLVVLAALTVKVAVAAEAVVPFTEATKYYDKTITAEGTIVGTFCDKERCFLNFDKDYHKYLSAVIQTSDLAKFSKAAPGDALKAEMDKMYTGKKVQITGPVVAYKGSKGDVRPQINLTAPDKIKVVK